MVERWGTRASDIGDDAAVLHVPRGDALVASVDEAIEDRHFRAEWLTPREIGYRAVTAAFSDLAAMAARPLGILLAVGIPERWRSELDAIADGVGDALAAAGTVILGGNIVSAPGLSLTTTVLGSAFSPLRRSGAKPGDRLYVTGRLGGPAAAILAWEQGRAPAAAHRERFARPIARLREARWLADRSATAAIDISDGFAADLQHLVMASGVGADVELGMVPLAAGVGDAVAAAASGEEFELVVASRDALDTDAFEEQFSLPLTEVGRVTGQSGELVFTLRGQRVAKPAGYDHLSR
jgi:thiamine-monophosphate kinase